MNLEEFKQKVPPDTLEVRTLALPIRNDQVLLGIKSRKMGKDWWNGFGGAMEDQDKGSIWLTAQRELWEEAGIVPGWFRRVAVLNFYFRDMPLHDTWNMQMQVFLCGSWGEKHEDTDEMHGIKFFPINELPLDNMWGFDSLWMPRVLNGEAGIEADFLYGPNKETLEHNLPDPA